MIDSNMDDAMKRFKRKRDEVLELVKTYPNIKNYDLSEAIYCANIKNLEKCRDAFTRYCPAHFRIGDVRFGKHGFSPVCRWTVEYLPDNDHLPGEDDALKTMVELILRQVPDNSETLGREFVEKEKVTVFYGVIDCQCSPPIFERTYI